MKKLLFLLASALAVLTVSASFVAATDFSRAAVTSDTKIVKAGFCPEHYEGYLCGIFVTVETGLWGKILRLVDPQPHVYQIRSESDWVDITEQILISYEVRYDAEEEGDFGKGVLYCTFTYRYPGGSVQTQSFRLETYI